MNYSSNQQLKPLRRSRRKDNLLNEIPKISADIKAWVLEVVHILALAFIGSVPLTVHPHAVRSLEIHRDDSDFLFMLKCLALQ